MSPFETGETSSTFVLVHGTWATDSSWTKNGSRLRKSLSATFPRSTFIRFRWSGWNTNRARAKAAINLQRRIRQIACESDNPIFVIAHSHGGNLVLQSIRDLEIDRALAGIVCLGTPFINAAPRKIESGYRYFISVAFVSIGLAFLFAAMFGITMITTNLMATFSPFLLLVYVSRYRKGALGKRLELLADECLLRLKMFKAKNLSASE